MAWLEQTPSGRFKVAFRFGGRRFKRSLKTSSEKSAHARLTRLEENIALVESGRLSIPPDADAAAFLLSDGKLNAKPRLPKAVTLAELFDEYVGNLPPGSLEAETLRIANIHFGHFRRLFGDNYAAARLGNDDLQQYVNHRSKESGKRGRPLSATTIRKELSSFRTVWFWARERGYLSGDFPHRNLRFPKTSEKPRFQVWSEIERQVNHGGLTQVEREELWDCLFLTVSEMYTLLDYIRDHAEYDFLYPMAVAAANTGARRSELARSRVGDFDLEGGTVLLREKKRVRGKRTTRQVPLSSRLLDVMAAWLEIKRPCPFTFPADYRVCRQRKPRENPDGISPGEASHHLRRVLAGSKWEKIRGWHIFRHSFISNCAARGIDQRMIDCWSGHQTDEMRRRYTHLFPDAQQKAIELVFESHRNSA